ncbi:MAG: hypothetical protein GYB68_08915 [Chloroflexi bacterium]|nr:hypothetical protein [Chloroflexota bacterium]
MTNPSKRLPVFALVGLTLAAAACVCTSAVTDITEGVEGTLTADAGGIVEPQGDDGSDGGIADATATLVPDTAPEAAPTEAPAEQPPADPIDGGGSPAGAGLTGLLVENSSLASGGTDTFDFDPQEALAVVVRVFSSEFDATLAVYGSDGAVLVEDDDSGGGTNPAVAINAIDVVGQVTIEVGSFAGTGSGAYQLEIYTAPVDLPAFDDVELPTYISSFAVGETLNPPAVSGFLEAHYFFFEGTAGQSITFTGTPNAEMDMTMALYSANGSELANEDVGFSGEQEVITISLPETGLYAIRTDFFSTGDGFYSITTQ